jgi:hypothetical protein
MGRKRYGDGAQRKVGRAYVRGPRWNAAQFHFVHSVITHVVSYVPGISLAGLYRELCYHHKSWNGAWIDPSRCSPDTLSHVTRLMLTSPAEAFLCFLRWESLYLVLIDLPSRTTFRRYVRWLSSPDPRFQLPSRGERDRNQPEIPVLGQPDTGDGEQHATIQMDHTDYMLLDIDDTVLFEPMVAIPLPEVPTTGKLDLPGWGVVVRVNAHYAGNILRIGQLWLKYTHPDGTHVWLPYTGQSTSAYYRELSLN